MYIFFSYSISRSISLRSSHENERTNENRVIEYDSKKEKDESSFERILFN